MSFDIPAYIEPQVQQFAQKQHITPAEAIVRLIEAGLSIQPAERQASMPRPSYGALFGAAKGGYGSPEAVDRAIEEMRNEW